MTSFADLPDECLIHIFGNVVISMFDDGISTLSCLNKCKCCFETDINCKHLNESEVVGIKLLKLVCKTWHDCISKYFVFKSAPIVYFIF